MSFRRPSVVKPRGVYYHRVRFVVSWVFVSVFFFAPLRARNSTVSSLEPPRHTTGTDRRHGSAVRYYRSLFGNSLSIVAFRGRVPSLSRTPRPTATYSSVSRPDYLLSRNRARSTEIPDTVPEDGRRGKVVSRESTKNTLKFDSFRFLRRDDTPRTTIPRRAIGFATTRIG